MDDVLALGDPLKRSAEPLREGMAYSSGREGTCSDSTYFW
jgi:hypothetical protein